MPETSLCTHEIHTWLVVRIEHGDFKGVTVCRKAVAISQRAVKLSSQAKGCESDEFVPIHILNIVKLN